MHELQGRAGAQGAGTGAVQHPRRLGHQEWAEPLASAKGAVAHGFQQQSGAFDLQLAAAVIEDIRQQALGSSRDDAHALE